jgi:hypothetical protein
VPLTSADFVQGLVDNVPEIEPTLTEHLADNGELLLHVFVARVRDAAIIGFENGDRDLSDRIVEVVDVGLRDGDEQVRNAVAVSFVEGTQWWEPNRAAFIRSWPPDLRGEAERQKDWSR